MKTEWMNLSLWLRGQKFVRRSEEVISDCTGVMPWKKSCTAGRGITYLVACTVPGVASRRRWPCLHLGLREAIMVVWLCGNLHKGLPSVENKLLKWTVEMVKLKNKVYWPESKRVPGLSTWTEFCAGLHTFYTASLNQGRPIGWRWCCVCRYDTWRAPGLAALSRTTTGIQRCTHIWRWSAPDQCAEKTNKHINILVFFKCMTTWYWAWFCLLKIEKSVSTCLYIYVKTKKNHGHMPEIGPSKLMH